MLAAQHRLLSMAVAVSLLFHLVLLSLHFSPPDSTRLKPLEAGLDIILVNASDDKVPLKAEALAQANLDGGGNADAGRATSPLPNSNNVVDGDALKTQRQRIEELEQHLQSLRILDQRRAHEDEARESCEARAYALREEVRHVYPSPWSKLLLDRIFS